MPGKAPIQGDFGRDLESGKKTNVCLPGQIGPAAQPEALDPQVLDGLSDSYGTNQEQGTPYFPDRAGWGRSTCFCRQAVCRKTGVFRILQTDTSN